LWQAPQVGYPANGNSYSDTGLPFVMSKNGAGVDPPDINVPYVMSGFIREDEQLNQFQPIVGNGAPTRDVQVNATAVTFQAMTQPNPPYLNRDYAANTLPSAKAAANLGALKELELTYDPSLPHWKMDSNGKFQPQYTSAGATPDLNVELMEVGYVAQAGSFNSAGTTIAISTPASGFWGNEYWLNLILTDANGQGEATRLRIHVILLANNYGGTKPNNP